MKQIALLILFMLNSLYVDCQTLMYNEDDISFISFIGDDYWDIVLERNAYPNRINEIIDTILTKWMGDDNVNLKFSSGIIGRLNNYYKDYPDAIFENNNVIPSYIFGFRWSDTTIGIRKYNLIIQLDNYGHLIDMNFPQIIYLTEKKYLSLDNAKELGDSLANLSIPDYKDFWVQLEFDECENDLFWKLFYSDGSTKKGGETYIYSFSMLTGLLSDNKSGKEINDVEEIILIEDIETEPDLEILQLKE